MIGGSVTGGPVIGALRSPGGAARLRIALLLTAVAANGAATVAQDAPTHGPFVGHVSPTTARVWARFSAPGTYTLRIPTTAGPGFSATAEASTAHDNCAVFEVGGLSPGLLYLYSIERDGKVIAGGQHMWLRTAPADDAPRTRIAFGSCADESAETARVWRALRDAEPEAVVLLGDTPYIDTTDLDVQRRRYREFAAVEELAELLRNTPWYGTWDDHDFGANDSDGRLPERADARQAFVEYHANPSYGDGRHGIYTSFRRGPVEVFLLDTRWFAAMEPSPVRAHAASLLGSAQWRWLQDGLRASTAPFKVLACGMIWNGATRPGKLDHWGSYPHERDALFAFLKAHSITGVVLVGGDIHRSRVIRHATAELAGHDLIELITSPLHGSIIETANAPHPGLVADLGAPHSFLLLDADAGAAPPTLDARFVDVGGKELFAIRVWPR